MPMFYSFGQGLTKMHFRDPESAETESAVVDIVEE